MTVAGGASRDLDVGKVIKQTFAVIGRNPVVFLLLTAVFVGLPAVAIGLFYEFAAARPAIATSPLWGFSWLPGYVAALVLGAILQASLIRATLQDLNGERADFGAALATGLRYLPRLLVLSIIMTVATFAGLAVLVFPGLMMLTTWAVAAPALVTENARIFAAFGRSARLTEGNRWRVFGLLMIYFVLTTALSLLLGLLMGTASLSVEAPTTLQTLVVDPILTALQSMVGAAGAAVLYFELRRIKEGVGVEQLASVFD